MEKKLDIYKMQRLEDRLNSGMTVCVVCGDLFPASNSVGKPLETCSDRCQQIRRKEVDNREFDNSVGVETVCVVCGKTFKGSHGRKVCSQDCKTVRARSYYRKKNNVPNVVKCPICGTSFEKEDNKKYCSDACRDKHQELNIEKKREYNRIKQQEYRKKLKEKEKTK